MSTPPPEHAEAVVRDLLMELETKGGPVLAALMVGQKVAGPLVTLPMRVCGERYSLLGPVGRVDAQIASPGATWELTPLAHGDPALPQERVRRGQAGTLEAADAAMCDALRELGWTLLPQAEVRWQWPRPDELRQEQAVALIAAFQAVAVPPDAPQNPAVELGRLVGEALSRWRR